MAREAPVTVPEQGGDGRLREASGPGYPGERRAQLEVEPIGEPAAPLPLGLDHPLVLPDRERERARALQKAPPRIQLGEAEIVEVDGDEAAEQDPAAPERHADLDVVDGLVPKPRRHGHPQERTQLPVDPVLGDGARPDVGGCGGQERGLLDGYDRGSSTTIGISRPPALRWYTA